MAVAWIESHEEISEHPKTYQLAGLLKVSNACAVGLVHCLWHFTLKFAWADGNLERFPADAIARGSKWEGDAELFVASLRKAGWMDGAKVHDWEQYAEHIIYQRNYNLKRKAAKSRANTCNTGVKQVYEPVNHPLPDLTLPDQTLPNQTITPTHSGGPQHAVESPKPEIPTALIIKKGMVDIALLAQSKSMGGVIEVAPDYKRPDTPLQKLLLVVKQLQGFTLDNRDWDSVYFKRYARAAKDLLKFFSEDWKQAGACAKDVTAWLDGLGKPWTVETIVNHAPAWKSGNLGGKKLAK